MQNKSLVIIDSYALIFRAYYAFPKNLRNREGELTNAIYGFTSLLLDVLKKFKPTNIIAVFDSQTTIIRQQEYSFYKAQRKETDTELLQQIPRVQEVLETMNIPVLRVDGYEADDVIGTIDKVFSSKVEDVIIVTGDQDIFQLIDDNTKVYLAGRAFSESKLFGEQDVFNKLEIKPSQVVDFKALCGDTSDNIPGVKGIGKKTAVQLISEYGSLENIYTSLDKIPPKISTKLSESYEIAMQSKHLATIVRDVPVSMDFSKSKIEDLDLPKIAEMFNHFEFKSLTNKLKDLGGIYKVKEAYGLFDLEEEDKTEQFDKLSNLDILKEENLVYLFPKYNTYNNPFEIEANQILLATKGNIYNLVIKDLEQLINFIEKNKIKILINDVKSFIHFLLNREIKLTEKIDFEDVGFFVQICSSGQYGHTEEAVRKYFDIDNLVNIASTQKIVEILINNSDPKVKKIYDLEKSIIQLVVDMERNGVNVNSDKIAEFKINLEEVKSQILFDIYRDVGHEFNVNSPKQVSDVLFLEKNLPKTKKMKSGAFSTDEKSLNRLKEVDPIVNNILRYREVDKLISTYINALPQYIHSDNKIHGTFDQMGSVSGRFSSKNPNMQNIPINNNLAVNVREAFVASDRNIFIAFDYSQQELRILAVLAGEDIMIEGFNKDLDIHKITAAEIFKKEISEVTDYERGIGKTINFSVIYGISSFGLSERMELDRKVAQEFIDTYFVKYPNIKKYFDIVKEQIKTQGYTETILGRKRQGSINLSNMNRFLLAAIERELTNFTIQGSAADIMKVSMSRFEPILQKYSAKLLLQIHDEFLFEFPIKKHGNPLEDENLKEFVDTIKDIMESAVEIGIKYRVDVKIGENWGNMNKI